MLEYVKGNFWVFLIVFNYVIAVSAVITVILKNVNPTKTLSYIAVLIFFPFLGLVVYYLFGQEYRKNKIFNRKRILSQSVIQDIHKSLALTNAQIKAVNTALGAKVKLIKLLQGQNKSPLTLNNNIKILKNGTQTFNALFKDLKAAQRHIHFEYYIIKDDVIGTKILDLLCQKAEEGLQVKLIYDDVGSKLSSKTRAKLKASGVLNYPFMPVIFSKFTGKMNYRNHRKIAVMDGHTAYVGGINIADEYLNDTNKGVFWRDTHLRIEGEAVKSLQINFFTTWDFVSNTRMEINKTYFPEVKIATDTAMQIASSGPDTDTPKIMEAIFLAIATAKKYVYITTPYFVPNDQIITALLVAAKSDVDVRVLIPKISDSWVVQHATNSYLEQLLAGQVKIYKYTKGFIHAKTLVVDDLFSTIGTSNMDYRSFNINFEINAFIYNKDHSKELKEHFLEDLKDSEQIRQEDWNTRSKLEKFKESYCRLWSPLI